MRERCEGRETFATENRSSHPVVSPIAIDNVRGGKSGGE